MGASAAVGGHMLDQCNNRVRYQKCAIGTPLFDGRRCVAVFRSKAMSMKGYAAFRRWSAADRTDSRQILYNVLSIPQHLSYKHHKPTLKYT